MFTIRTFSNSTSSYFIARASAHPTKQSTTPVRPKHFLLSIYKRYLNQIEEELNTELKRPAQINTIKNTADATPNRLKRKLRERETELDAKNERPDPFDVITERLLGHSQQVERETQGKHQKSAEKCRYTLKTLATTNEVPKTVQELRLLLDTLRENIQLRRKGIRVEYLHALLRTPQSMLRNNAMQAELFEVVYEFAATVLAPWDAKMLTKEMAIDLAEWYPELLRILDRKQDFMIAILGLCTDLQRIACHEPEASETLHKFWQGLVASQPKEDWSNELYDAVTELYGIAQRRYPEHYSIGTFKQLKEDLRRHQLLTLSNYEHLTRSISSSRAPNRFLEVADLIKEMKDHHIRPNGTIYTNYVRSSLTSAHLRRALGLVFSERKQLAFTAATLASLVESCVKKRAWDEISTLLNAPKILPRLPTTMMQNIVYYGQKEIGTAKMCIGWFHKNHRNGGYAPFAWRAFLTCALITKDTQSFFDIIQSYLRQCAGINAVPDQNTLISFFRHAVRLDGPITHGVSQQLAIQLRELEDRVPLDTRASIRTYANSLARELARVNLKLGAVFKQAMTEAYNKPVILPNTFEEECDQIINLFRMGEDAVASKWFMRLASVPEEPRLSSKGSLYRRTIEYLVRIQDLQAAEKLFQLAAKSLGTDLFSQFWFKPLARQLQGQKNEALLRSSGPLDSLLQSVPVKQVLQDLVAATQAPSVNKV